MPDAATRMLEEETEADRLRRALVDVEADLRGHSAALSKFQGELAATRLEVSGARGETVQFQGLVRRAQAEAGDVAAAHARIALLDAAALERDAEIMRLHATIVALQGETQALRTGMDVLRASLSWRISAPVRVAGRLMRRVLTRQAGPRLSVTLAANLAAPPPVLAPPPAPAAGDPNARYIFQAAPWAEPGPGEAEGVVTLDALYHLSRSL